MQEIGKFNKAFNVIPNKIKDKFFVASYNL